MDKTENKHKSNISEYKLLFEKCKKFFSEIQGIIIIALNDVLFKDHITSLNNNTLINDTIEAIVKSNFNLENLFDFQKLKNLFKEDKKENKFLEISLIYDNLLNDNLIIKEKGNKILIEKLKNENLKISKKNYEVEICGKFMVDKLSKNKINTVIEMGCGKSYLTDLLFEHDNNLIYIGIDKESDLITKSTFNTKNETSKNNKKNKNILNKNRDNIKKNNISEKENKFHEEIIEKKIILYNFHIDNNFYEFYLNTIKKDIINLPNKNNSSESNILLFGLHSCGNLTSDSLKIFSDIKNTEFKSIIIISCCLHLVKEYISEEAKNLEIFKDHIKRIGYDSKGNFLDETLLYNYDLEKIGYPLSSFIKENHKELFFTRTVRKSAMQSFPDNENKLIDLEDFFYKTRLFRSLFQAFLEEFFSELSNYYGYGDVEYDPMEQGDFNKFISYLKKNLEKLKNEENKIGKKFKELKIENFKNLLEKYENLIIEQTQILKFYENYVKSQNLLWACFLIKMKFSKIVELIIILDRIIYLLENNVNEVNLVEIFEYTKSKRNYLIYATK